MIELLREHLISTNLIREKAKIIVACSGGADSIALADLLHRLNYNIVVAHVNFGLRSDASDADESFVKNFAVQLDIPFFSKSFNTRAEAAALGIGIQETARFLRYAWFHELLDELEADRIATAHHEDDVVETYLAHILRGSSLGGFSSIPQKNGAVIRPLLPFKKTDLLDHLTKFNIPFREDESNVQNYYTRNKIRLQLIPMMESIRPGFKNNILRQINLFKELNPLINQFLSEMTDEFIEPAENGLTISLDMLTSFPYPRLLLSHLCADYGFPAKRVDEVVGLLNSQNGKYLASESHRITKERGSLVISINPENDGVSYVIEAETKEFNGPIDLVFTHHSGFPELTTNADEAFIDFGKLSFPLTLRRWEAGDRFKPLGMNGFQKLSDFFTQQKMGNEEKRNVWIMESKGDIVWVVGYRIDDRFKISENTRNYLHICVLK
jgi:tRNA(Ile)-lysidine synthase